MTPPDTSVLDDARYEFVPLPQRPSLKWANGLPLALYPILLVEHYEDVPPEGSLVAGDVFGGLGPGGALRRPQITRVGNRDYGHRVGFFRLADALVQAGIPPTVAIDAESAERYPAIVDWATSHGAEIVAHGVAVTRAVSSAMAVDEERAYIADATERITKATGTRPRGWLGPAASESGRSLQLLADAGFEYCLDWPNDEQPYWFDTEPRLLSLPLLIELSDNHAINQRGVLTDDYAQMLTDAVDQLASDGRSSARLMAFTLHPWTSGQPARVHTLRTTFASMAARGDVWFTSPGELAAEVAALGLKETGQ
jgi:peptidoglycan/xylan/chitin deacetylase (PgdA/CDA1 family)